MGPTSNDYMADIWRFANTCHIQASFPLMRCALLRCGGASILILFVSIIVVEVVHRSDVERLLRLEVGDFVSDSSIWSGW